MIGAWLKKAAGWVLVIAFVVYVINNIDQVMDIFTTAVMFCVGIFEKLGDAAQDGAERADQSTALYDLIGTAVRLASAVLGG